MRCETCDDTDYVTVKVKCADPDNCDEGGPIDGFHELDVKCPCCSGGERDDDDDEEDEEDEDD